MLPFSSFLFGFRTQLTFVELVGGGNGETRDRKEEFELEVEKGEVYCYAAQKHLLYCT